MLFYSDTQPNYAFVKLGIGITPADIRCPAYHAADLLKLNIYGYLNRIQSNRRLERASLRNIELMRLTGRLPSDFKTIANFRKDNGVGIRNVCRQFLLLCRNLDLFTEQIIAIDGSKFNAVNNRAWSFTMAKVQARLQQIEESIWRYLSMLDTVDRTVPVGACAKTGKAAGKITLLKEQMQALKKVEANLPDSPYGQIPLTDPDARSMATNPVVEILDGATFQV